MSLVTTDRGQKERLGRDSGNPGHVYIESIRLARVKKLYLEDGVESRRFTTTLLLGVLPSPSCQQEWMMISCSLTVRKSLMIKVEPKIGIGIYKGWDVALSYLRGWGERERARLMLCEWSTKNELVIRCGISPTMDSEANTYWVIVLCE
jgi:hypothetical protein